MPFYPWILTSYRSQRTSCAMHRTSCGYALRSLFSLLLFGIGCTLFGSWTIPHNHVDAMPSLARIRSGDCKANGFRMIISKQECEHAAYELGLTDTSTSSKQSNERPHGCIYSNNIVPELILESPRDLIHGISACGTMSNNKIYDCICAKDGNIGLFS